MAKCRLCRTEIPAIKALGEREFIFDWLPFHWGNSECVRLIALTMEPANPGARQESDPVMSASRLLIYALRRLLIRPEDGFMITPIAKCSLEVSKAKETHGQRWDLCSPFLLQEIDALKEARLLCPNFFVVTVGNHPDGVLTKGPSMKKFLPQRLGKLTHYGAFREFKIAPADQEAFAQFRKKHEPDYRAFVKEHVPWDQDKLGSELKQDMQILFKWDRQMDPWRERLL
jgi:uracil-DNA glycosylase